MGSGASTGADPSKLSPEEKQKFIESMLHGEVTDLANTFAAELDRIHRGDVTAEDVKNSLAKSLSARRSTIVERIKQREEEEAKEEAAASLALSARAANDAEARYARQVSLTNANLMKRAAKTFMVGVDGSSSADMAYQVAMTLRKKVDNIILFHTYKIDEENTEVLPYQYRPKVVRTKYESLLVSSLPSHNYFLGFHSRPDDKTAKQAITEIIDKTSSGVMSPAVRLTIGNNAPDFLCIGFSGRKSEMENRAFMGSKADLALRTVHIPIIICKRPIPLTSSKGDPKVGRSFVFAVALTETSRKGLDILMTILGPKDDLLIVHVKESSELDHVVQTELEKAEQFYTSELHQFGPAKSRFLALDPTSGVSSVDRLADYVNDETEADFLVIAPRAAQTVTSLSESLILKCKTNVILCKQ
jgi:nucleotide-binding universal stress UspA family protein